MSLAPEIKIAEQRLSVLELARTTDLLRLSRFAELKKKLNRLPGTLPKNTRQTLSCSIRWRSYIVFNMTNRYELASRLS
ncbi:MAG: hypothetical protein BWY63_02463 [Chloroflexi bacterium ADurb.Bin360]|nr:MAG: hypothetical protein BWY63_02463 [Chloroflexi bacterium ADurb.Bin360]